MCSLHGDRQIDKWNWKESPGTEPHEKIAIFSTNTAGSFGSSYGKK